VGGGAALLGQAAQAAPAGLAATAAQAGLAAGGAAAGINLVLFHLMSLTKTQTAAACLLVAAMPLTWQWQAGARLAREQAEANDRQARAGRRVAEIENDLQRVRDDLLGAQAAALEAERQRDLFQARLAGKAPAPHYQWDDNSPLVRVPKAMLAQLNLSAVANRRGEVSGQIKEVLQMSEAETGAVQAAVNRFVAEYDSARAASARRVEPNEEEKRWRPDEEVRVFEMPDVTAQFKTMRAALFSEIDGALGRERSEFFEKKLQDWMPVEDERYYGLSSGNRIFPYEHRIRFSPCTYGFPALGWGMSKVGAFVSGPMPIEEIPDYLRPQLQDWIAVAQSKPPLK